MLTERQFLVLLIAIVASSVPASGFAGGRKNPSCSKDSNPVARPIRPVSIKSVGTQVFHLPNGSDIDLSNDLHSILHTVLTEQSSFSPVSVDGGTLEKAADECEPRLEFRSAVTSFQMIGNGRIKFGYGVEGGPPGTEITGEAKVNLGSVSMDFSVWKCVSGKCISIAASTGNNLMVEGSGVTFGVDFSKVRTSAEFLYTTRMAELVRKIMAAGLKGLEQNSSVDRLPWQATVTEVNANDGTFVFDAGTQGRIQKNQEFEVYSPLEATTRDGCPIYHLLAYGRTDQVSSILSRASVYQVFDSAGIKPGNVVMIHLQ